MLNVRRKIKLLLIGASLALLFLHAPAVWAGNTLQVGVKDDVNVLRIGVSTNAPPLVFKQKQAIVGLEPELAKAFAASINRRMQFIELDWQDQIPALLENRIDIIMSGMSVTPLRQVRIAFSNAYFRSGQMALVRDRDRHRFTKGYYSIAAATNIGVVKGTTGEFFARKRFFNAKIKSYDTARQGVADLLINRINVLIHDAPIILVLASENETNGLTPIFSLLTEEYLAWGIRKDDTALLKSANRSFHRITGLGRMLDFCADIYYDKSCIRRLSCVK